MATRHRSLLTIQSLHNTLAAAGLVASCLPIFAAAVEVTFCVDLGGVAGGGVGTGADCPMETQLNTSHVS